MQPGIKVEGAGELREGKKEAIFSNNTCGKEKRRNSYHLLHSICKGLLTSQLSEMALWKPETGKDRVLTGNKNRCEAKGGNKLRTILR